MIQVNNKAVIALFVPDPIAVSESQSGYDGVKAGDLAAANILVNDLVSDEVINSLRETIELI